MSSTSNSEWAMGPLDSHAYDERVGIGVKTPITVRLLLYCPWRKKLCSSMTKTILTPS